MQVKQETHQKSFTEELRPTVEKMAAASKASRTVSKKKFLITKKRKPRK